MIALPVTASAATFSVYQVDATPTSSYPYFGTFSLTFTDIDGDLVLSADEIDTFSGFSYNGTYYDDIAIAPAVPGVADGLGLVWFSPSFWGFETPAGSITYFFSGAFTYSRTLLNAPAAAVPLPASALLLLSAVAGLGFARRRSAA